ncbi:MAG: helix-turn-helix domain-containing protein [Bryobacteraceae bacterium]
MRNHPGIFAWIAMNEAGREASTVRPGPQLVAEAKALDPTRPTIKNTSARDDPESGDGHDYRGSLGGGKYTDIYGTSEKLAMPIEAFDDPNYALEGSTPDSRLRSLMEEHGLRQRDLLDVFGSRGVASEVVSGKRAISKAQAKKLAELFHVPADQLLVR